MSNTPSLETNNLKYADWLLANVFLHGLFIGVFSPITAVCAYVFAKQPVKSPVYLTGVTLSLGWFVLFSHPVFLPDTTTLSYWILSIPLFPIGSVAVKGIVMFSRFLKPQTLQEIVKDEEQRLEKANQRLEEQARSAPETAAENEWLGIGAVIKSDIFPDHLGIKEKDRWLFLHEDVLDQHIFLLGTTGAGKSETIKRLILEILTKTARDVYFVDGKGDEKLANDIRSLAHHTGRGRAPVFRLGFDTHGAIYDGFRGQKTDVYNRLCALIGVEEAEGGAAYFADINRELLQLICYAPEGVPRSFEEIRERLSKSWLMTAYKHDPVEYETIQEIDNESFQGLARRIRPLAREFSPLVGPDGFSLEQTTCAIFSMRVQSASDTAKRFLDFLVEDLKDFVGKRQQRPAVLVIDEFGQFSNNNIIALLTLARSSKLGVILATQDTASLKDDATKKLVLANTRTKILMASDFPEEVAELAGTRYQVESSMQHEDGEITGTGSARVQHAFKVDMNEAAKLKPGEAFVIRQRHAAKVKVRAIGAVDHIKSQEPEQRAETAVPEDKKKVKRPPKL